MISRRTQRLSFRRSLSKEEHLREADRLASLYFRKKGVHERYLRMADRKFGTPRFAPRISGGFHESWPEGVKANVRKIRSSHVLADEAYNHYLASGHRSSTWNRFLARHQKHTRTRSRR